MSLAEELLADLEGPDEDEDELISDQGEHDKSTIDIMNNEGNF